MVEKYKEVIAELRKRKTIATPSALTDKIMKRLEQANVTPAIQEKHCIIRHIENIKTKTIRLSSTLQSAFLLLLVGFFYLLSGITAVWNLCDAVSASNLNIWFKIQPFIPIGSGILILTAAFMMFYRSKKALFIQYMLILHVIFVFVNGIILEKILSAPVVLIYVLILTMLAVILGIVLIGAVRSVLKGQIIDKDGNRAKAI